MIKPLSILCLTAALGAALVSAQTSEVSGRTAPSPAQMVQRQVQMRTTVLSLTADQQAQATTIFTNSASSNSGLHSTMRTAQTALKTAIQNNDTAGIEQAANTLGTLHAQMTASQAKAEAAFYNLLTPEQKTKYTQLESQGHFGGMGGGPGFRGGR